MKKLVIVSVILAVFIFSSCEKEMKEVKELEETQLLVNVEYEGEVDEVVMTLVSASQNNIDFDSPKVGENVFSLEGVDLSDGPFYLYVALYAHEDGKPIYLNQHHTKDFPLRTGEVNEVDVKFK